MKANLGQDCRLVLTQAMPTANYEGIPNTKSGRNEIEYIKSHNALVDQYMQSKHKPLKFTQE